MTDDPPALPRLAPPDPPLADEVVRLRPFLDEDADAVFRACQDPVIAQWVPIPAPYTVEHAETYVRGAQAGWSGGPDLPLAITDARTGELLGSIALHRREGPRWAVGYWVAPWARRRGVGTSALRLLSRWALREFGLVRLSLYTLDGNEASQRTALAAGFQREGVMRNYDEHRGELRDAVFFSLIPADIAASPRLGGRESAG